MGRQGKSARIGGEGEEGLPWTIEKEGCFPQKGEQREKQRNSREEESFVFKGGKRGLACAHRKKEIGFRTGDEGEEGEGETLKTTLCNGGGVQWFCPTRIEEKEC